MRDQPRVLGPGPAPAAPAAVRVVLADDSLLFREGLARVLAENGFMVVGQAGDADALRVLAGRDEPDVVVTDIRMPPTNTNDGLLAAQRIRAEHPSVGVLVLSQYVETRQAIRLLQHSPARPALACRLYPSAEGRSNHAICQRLFLLPKRVETHVGSIFAKLGLLPATDDHRRVLAVLTCIRNA
jgi:DNA-binding NarL/FixJ family response regulator